MKKKTNQITNFKYYLPYFIRGIIAFFILLALTLLIYFFELACAMSGKLLEVNPFNQPGVEKYKTNMFKFLGKPGYWY